MTLLFCFKVLILTTLSRATQLVAYKDGVTSECLGNLLRVSVDGYLLAGKQVQVDILNGSDVIGITPFLAAQCGYSLSSDPWGNTRLYTSLQHCYAQSRDEGLYGVNLQLRTHGADGAHTVSRLCSYPHWASREVLCSHNYMEVSVVHDLPISEQLEWMMSSVKDATYSKSGPLGTKSSFRLEKVVMYTPAERGFTPLELHRLGYGLYTTTTRLLMRSPYDTAEVYSQDVAGVPMVIMRSSVVYKHRWMLSLVNAATACPTGGVFFTEDLIIWRLPRNITPLLSSSSSVALEAFMGIDGQRLDQVTMLARGYSFHHTDSHFVVEMPMGSPDGYYKSRAHNGQYHTTYFIEPMVELLWTEMGGLDETRYKVLLPISTPPILRPPFVTNYTVLEERVFKMTLGTFLPDVELINITINSSVMTIAETIASGFKIQEHVFSNGSKAFSLQVPFSHPNAVKRYPNVKTTTYTLHLGFDFLILPENTTFSHCTVLHTAVEDTDLANITGSCDQENFYVTVQYGSRGLYFNTLIGNSLLTAELGKEYSLYEEGTRFSLIIPFGAPDIVFQAVRPSFVRGRLDMALQDREMGWNITYFSLACSFITSVIECTPNGTVGALAVKLEAVSSLNPGQLTLNDPSCGPYYSDERFAFFHFSVDTCGTTREFENGMMVYKNMASLKNHQRVKKTQLMGNEEPKYQFLFSCVYSVNATKTLAFFTASPSNVPVAKANIGELIVQMRLAQDWKYTQFYSDGDYPVASYHKRPLYFEVELVRFEDSNVEVVLDDCWATKNKDRTSEPRWDIIVDSCPNPKDPDLTVFHPVRPDHRVQFPSLFKRFEVKMFSFAKAEDAPAGQVVFHCDVVICDSSSPMNGLCKGQCAYQQKGTYNMKRGSRAVSELHIEPVSSGLIFLL